MNLIFDIRQRTADAVSEFWRTKQQQLKASKDSSGRGAVTGGKQMDGFLSLIRDACIAVGTPEQCIFDKNNYLPGFFRSSKDWDLIIISPKGKLIAAIELKSQVGSILRQQFQQPHRGSIRQCNRSMDSVSRESISHHGPTMDRISHVDRTRRRFYCPGQKSREPLSCITGIRQCLIY